MKIRGLYSKLLLSFLGVLAVTLGLILVLFLFTAGRSHKASLELKTMSKLQLLQGLIQETIDNSPELDAADNPQLLKQISDFSDLFNVSIWLSDAHDQILFQTFEDQPEVSVNGSLGKIYKENGIILYNFALKWIKYYAVIPITCQTKELKLHMYYDARDLGHPEFYFLAGLICFGGLVAVMVLPLAGLITRRINQLNQTALEFAGGNLSSRARISGHDEIANLGHSFNVMADKLEKLIQNTKELTANVSHELRSPLARLELCKELIHTKLDQQADRKNLDRYFENMESDIRHLDSLVADMLTLSKMDYQESSLSPESFFFASFLDKELMPYRSMIQTKRQQLELCLDGQVNIFQDKFVIKTIVTNLLDNAIKYSPAGSTIQISARPGVTQGSLELAVANPADPIPEKELAAMLKPFYRRANPKNAAGTGLGLTIIKKQVDLCNGELIVDQDENNTLSFTIKLP